MEIGSFRDVGRLMDHGVCGMIRCFGHFSKLFHLKSESFRNTGECGKDGAWGEDSIWGCFGIRDIGCFMEVDDLRSV